MYTRPRRNHSRSHRGFPGSLLAALACAAAIPLISLAAAPPKAPSNLCIGDNNCAGPRDKKTFKWNPGNYMLLYPGSPQSQLADIANEPYVEGAQIRYYWADLEKGKNQYDFSQIESDLRYLQSMQNPKRLVIQIFDRKFNTSSPEGVVPSYLLTDPEYGGGIAKTRNGYAARIWEPAVMDREIALFTALAARFDAEPYFEGITTEETIIPFGTDVPVGYSHGALVSQLKRLMEESRKAWTQTNVFIFSNYLAGKSDPQYMIDIVSHAFTTQCGVGGPDLFSVPKHDPTQGMRAILGLIGGVDYRGKTPIAFAVQSPELCGKEGCHTPEEIYNYAVDTLHVNYIFWQRFGTTKDTATEKYSWQYGMLPLIRDVKGATNSACPLNLLGRCVSN